jgi:hypothetical protein
MRKKRVAARLPAGSDMIRQNDLAKSVKKSPS